MTMNKKTLAAALLGTALLYAGAASAQEHEAPPAHDSPVVEAHESTTGGHEEGHGGGAHHATFDGKAFAFQLANFGALVFVLVFFGGKAINKALRQRHETMKAELAESAQLRAAAEARLKEQEGRLANLEQELARLRASLKAEADAEKARLVAAAEERARRIGTETQFLLEQQVKDAELRFRAEVASAASRIAEEIIRKDLAATDQARLAQAFVAEVESGAANGHHRDANVSKLTTPPSAEIG